MIGAQSHDVGTAAQAVLDRLAAGGRKFLEEIRYACTHIDIATSILELTMKSSNDGEMCEFWTK